ncbi:sulfatase-like hydrolase/transferase [Flavobacterium ginsengisoli]|uniref:sulfatase-like hydrolase/transferase n=1 Tax=Flavobacterium ginsengisoli TaxID=871694 RepID=UPI00241542AB|nr:sulfatase-like hydrolase/transferase [Flavobacterium ginsengisoli]
MASKPKDSVSGKKTNVIIILADDLGKYDISLYGGKTTPTPQIDSLVASGVTFTDGYASASNLLAFTRWINYRKISGTFWS